MSEWPPSDLDLRIAENQINGRPANLFGERWVNYVKDSPYHPYNRWLWNTRYAGRTESFYKSDAELQVDRMATPPVLPSMNTVETDTKWMSAVDMSAHHPRTGALDEVYINLRQKSFQAFQLRFDAYLPAKASLDDNNPLYIGAEQPFCLDYLLVALNGDKTDGYQLWISTLDWRDQAYNPGTAIVKESAEITTLTTGSWARFMLTWRPPRLTLAEKTAATTWTHRAELEAHPLQKLGAWISPFFATEPSSIDFSWYLGQFAINALPYPESYCHKVVDAVATGAAYAYMTMHYIEYDELIFNFSESGSAQSIYMKIQVSPDNSTWYDYLAEFSIAAGGAPTAAQEARVTEWHPHIRVGYKNNSGAGTANCWMQVKR